MKHANAEDNAAVEAIDPRQLSMVKTSKVIDWVSGWLGINYAVPLHGFAEMSMRPGGAVADFLWLAPDDEVHWGVRLRYVRARASIDMYTWFDDQWGREQSEKIPVGLRSRMREFCGGPRTQPEELFTRLCVPYASMFEVLTPAWAETGLHWDHHWHPGPDNSYLWRPVELGTGLGPFTVREASDDEDEDGPPVNVRLTALDGVPGYRYSLLSMHVFVPIEGEKRRWTLVLPEQVRDNDVGPELDPDEVPRDVVDEIMKGMRFLKTPRPMV